MTKKASH